MLNMLNLAVIGLLLLARPAVTATTLRSTVSATCEHIELTDEPGESSYGFDLAYPLGPLHVRLIPPYLPRSLIELLRASLTPFFSQPQHESQPSLRLPHIPLLPPRPSPRLHRLSHRLLIELAWVIKNKAWKQPMRVYYEEERRGWFRRRVWF
jgi:hypothetical protein